MIARAQVFLLAAWSASIACAPRPVELGLWFDEGLAYRSARIGDPIAPNELARIEQLARAEIEQAFSDFEVTVSASHDARYRVHVVEQLNDQRVPPGGTFAGESRAIAGFGGSGAVNFEFVANGAMIFSPESASRSELIDALGRGVGRVAIHEFLHQLLPTAAIHDSKDPHSYEGNSPALVEGYYGELHWDIAQPWLQSRLAPRPR